MNRVDILVIVVVVLIFVSVIAYLIIEKKKGACSSCPAVKHLKKDVKKAQKSIKDSQRE